MYRALSLCIPGYIYACIYYTSDLTTLEEPEIIPGKHSETRIKPLALANGYTFVRWVMSIKYIAAKVLFVSLPKWPFGGFRSESATWIQKLLKKTRWNF